MTKVRTLLSSTKFLLFMVSILLVAVIGLGSMLASLGSTVEAAEPLNISRYTARDTVAREDAAREDAAQAATASELAPTATTSTAAQAVALAEPAQDAANIQPNAQPNVQQQGTQALVYTGNVRADETVPVAVEVVGQVLIVNGEVGDRVQKGDVLLQLDSTSLEAQRAQALAGLQAAQAQLDGLLLDADASDVNAAQAALSAANSAYQKAVEGPTAEDLEIAESQLRQAEAAVKRAQAAYDRVAWNPAIAALPESQQLEQATLQLDTARAQYEKVQQGATQDVINGAYAQVVSAQAQLDRILKGATQPQIDAAQAQINQAETALYLAQLQVDKATVRAPIDGVIAQVNVAVGANSAPGNAAFVLLSNDVKIVVAVEETRLAQISVGDAATIRVNAYPDRTFAGEVATIAPELDPATRTANVTIRPTDIRPADDATPLSPGMFATVELGR